ncbi:MAG: hypothetical protein ACRYGB_15675 [Janthinobacterium lividum]
MNKLFKLRKALLAPAMLFLCGVFLQSCTEEMPILSANDLIGKTSNASSIALKVNTANYTLVNKDPGYAIFAPVTSGTGTTSNIQYNVSGSNGLQTGTVDFVLAYTLTSSNTYVLTTSQLDLNNKTYTTLNASGNAQLTIVKMDVTANTASGSYGYYLYDSPSSPTDSVYVSGTFNIVK